MVVSRTSYNRFPIEPVRCWFTLSAGTQFDVLDVNNALRYQLNCTNTPQTYYWIQLKCILELLDLIPDHCDDDD